MIWIAMAVAAGFFNAFWTALSKKILEHQSPREFTFVFRALTCLFLLPFALFQWTWPMSMKWWLLTAFAGILEGSRIWLLTLGVKQDYYATYAFYNLSPFFTVALAPLLLTTEHWSLTLVGGGLFITLGAFLFHRLGRWSWPGLLGAFFSTLAAILSKSLLLNTPPLFFAFWSFGIGALILIPLEKLDRKDSKLRFSSMKKHWVKILPVAFWSLIATILFYTALEHESVSKVNPLVRANLLFGFLFSYFLLKEKKDWIHKIIGGGLILAGLLLVALA
jgi:drug/metabolite transporter (DMT)-like permease